MIKELPVLKHGALRQTLPETLRVLPFPLSTLFIIWEARAGGGGARVLHAHLFLNSTDVGQTGETLGEQVLAV